jgi:hypothetical protein
MTMSTPTHGHGPGAYRAPSPSAMPSGPGALFERARRFFRDHGRKMWWLHSAYALALGVGVVAFAQKGLEHARWLAVTIVAAWMLVIVFFRVHGSGARQASLEAAGSKTRFRFFVMTYVLKNLYQGMLFFLLPFYWKSTTFGAANEWFVVVLAACAIVSTLDIVFDRYLMKWRALASAFHGITLFGSLNLVIPAIFPDTRTLVTLLFAAAIAAIAVWTLHAPMRALGMKVYAGVIAASVLGSVGVAYAARAAIPPVPMHLSYEAVGPFTTKDGRLAMEVKTLHSSVITQLLAVTDVVTPGGSGDRLHHVWRRDGLMIATTGASSRQRTKEGNVRLQSSLAGRELPKDLAGAWTVDVETEDGQLVGRASFVVID